MRAVVVGFPKAGTTTLHEAFASSGLRTAHWTHNRRPVGRLVYKGLVIKGDPFFYLRDLDVVTQMDFTAPEKSQVFWPNLDFGMLYTIRRLHPDCKFILNFRDPMANASSILRWGDFADRIIEADLPGLPHGYGRTAQQLAQWIQRHHQALRDAFGGKPNFVEVDIASPDAPRILGEALGVEIKWWGVANANTRNKAA